MIEVLTWGLARLVQWAWRLSWCVITSHGVIFRGLLGLAGSTLAREEKARQQEQDRLGG
jgi:hypothetical protein